MASNYNRKSNSSASRRTNASKRKQSQARSSRQASSARSSSRSTRSSSRRPQGNSQGYTSVRIGDIDQRSRAERARKRYRSYVLRLTIIAGFVLALGIGGFALYNSNLFMVNNVSVTGVEHLTASEMTELASVPAGTTLLRVDAAGIKDRLLKNAWVKEVNVKRVFSDTLELQVTERTISAVVKISMDNAQTEETWAIASDGMWLMHIPDAGTAEAALISSKVYEDADKVLKINDVPYGVIPEEGSYCNDGTVNNALSIIDGLTTELADQITEVSATGTDNATLKLDNGIEIAFGDGENIREKERVCLELMEKNPGQITYINVRVVEKVTYKVV